MALTPTPASFTDAVAAVLGPTVGPFAMIIFAAVVGGLLGLSKAGVTTRLEGLRHLVLSVALSLVLTGSGVWTVSHFTSLPGDLAMMPVSFFIAASREYLLDLIKSVLTSVADFVSGIAGKRGGS